MIVSMKNTIRLTESERMELSQRAGSQSGRADDSRRARLILLLESGATWAQIRDKLDSNDAFTGRWGHPLEHPQTGRGAVDFAHDGGPRVGQARPEAPARGALHGLERRGLRAQGRRHHWAVSESANACGGILRGREDGDPGAGPQGSDVAAVSGPCGTTRL